MEYSNDKVGIRNRRNTVSTGRIFIPFNIKDRDIYVQSCFNTETVCLMTLDGEFIQKAIIDKHTLQNVEFPEKYPELGSQVIILTEPIKNQAMVIGVMNNGIDTQLLNESEFRLFKTKDGVTVSLSGSAKHGNLSLRVENSGTGKSDFKIEVLNANNDAKVEVNVSGTVSINASKEIILNNNKLNSYITDINKLTAKLNILEKEMQDIKDVFANWTPVVQDGGASLKAAAATWAEVAVKQTKIEDINDPKIKN